MKELLAAVLLLGSCQALASEWRYIAESDVSMVYMDFSSITTPSPGKRRAWVMYVEENNESSKDFMAYDCLNRESAGVSSVKYNAKGGVVESTSTPKPHFTPIVPDSIGETAFLIACNPKERAAAIKRRPRTLDPKFDAQLRWAPPASAESADAPKAGSTDGLPSGCNGECAGGYYSASLKKLIFKSDCESTKPEFQRGCLYWVEQEMRRRADGY